MTGRVDSRQIPSTDCLGEGSVSSSIRGTEIAQLAQWKRSCMRKDGPIGSKHPVLVSIHNQPFQLKNCRVIHNGGDFWRREVILEQIAQGLCIKHLNIWQTGNHDAAITVVVVIF